MVILYMDEFLCCMFRIERSSICCWSSKVHRSTQATLMMMAKKTAEDLQRRKSPVPVPVPVPVSVSVSVSVTICLQSLLQYILHNIRKRPHILNNIRNRPLILQHIRNSSLRSKHLTGIGNGSAQA